MKDPSKIEQFNKLFVEAKDRIMLIEAATIAAMEQREVTLDMPALPSTWRLLQVSRTTIFWQANLSLGFDNPLFNIGYSIALEEDDKLWLHLSISKSYKASDQKQISSYGECAAIRNLVFGDKWSIQYFPKKEEYVNLEEVLHFWHCLEANPMPDFRKGCGMI